MMKIAIVHDYITKVGGAQNVLKILHQIFPDAPIYTLLYDREGTKGEFDDCNIITSSLQGKPAFLRKRIKLMLMQFPKAIEEFDLSPYDIVISSSNSFSHGVITRPGTLHICYCYSPMRYAWDWHIEYLRENGLDKGVTSFIVRRMMKSIREWDFLASSRVDRWVAISKTVKSRIKKYYRCNSDVIYPPADIENLLKLKTSDNGYYLMISTLTPYKKIDLAIEAFNINGKHLVIAGDGGDRKRLQSLAKSKNVEFTGYVTDEEKQKLLSGCHAFIFPGEEDFGLTPVEAMACGKPVVALNKGGVPESVIDNVTGVLFDQPNAISLNQAIDELENLIIDQNTCRKRSKDFSTDRFVKQFKHFVDSEYKAFNEK